MKYSPIFLLFAIFFVPIFAHAETVLRIGDNISVDKDQVVDGDYYVSVGPLGNTTMSGSIQEDMYAFGGTVTANGSVGKDLTIIGGATQMNATVTDDVRIVGGEVTIGEHVGGDLFIIGGTAKILSTATIDGDVIFFGGTADIEGKIGGSILGTSEKIRIDAEVKGDVDIKTASELTLGEKAHIGGAVHYSSLDPLIRAQNATVDGEVTASKYGTKTITAETKVRDSLIPVFITLFAALSIYLLFRKELQKLVSVIQHRTVKTSLIGLSTIVLGPIVALLFIVTILGVLVGIICAALVILLYIGGYAACGAVLGSYLSKIFTKRSTVSLPWVLLGTLAIQLMLFVPVIGPLVVFGIFSMTVGGLVISTYKLLA